MISGRSGRHMQPFTSSYSRFFMNPHGRNRGRKGRELRGPRSSQKSSPGERTFVTESPIEICFYEVTRTLSSVHSSQKPSRRSTQPHSLFGAPVAKSPTRKAARSNEVTDRRWRALTGNGSPTGVFGRAGRDNRQRDTWW